MEKVVADVEPVGDYPTMASFRKAVYGDPSQVRVQSLPESAVPFSGTVEDMRRVPLEMLRVHGMNPEKKSTWTVRVLPRAGGKYVVALAPDGPSGCVCGPTRGML